jgi:hypothetical protein
VSGSARRPPAHRLWLADAHPDAGQQPFRLGTASEQHASPGAAGSAHAARPAAILPARQPDPDSARGAVASSEVPMTDHLAHLQRPEVVTAEKAWADHFEGCVVCQAATERTRQACPEGTALHEAAVRAAQDAYRAARPEAFAPESHGGS